MDCRHEATNAMVDRLMLSVRTLLDGEFANISYGYPVPDDVTDWIEALFFKLSIQQGSADIDTLRKVATDDKLRVCAAIILQTLHGQLLRTKVSSHSLFDPITGSSVQVFDLNDFEYREGQRVLVHQLENLPQDDPLVHTLQELRRQEEEATWRQIEEALGVRFRTW